MGGERASKTYQKERGYLCQKCGKSLGPPPAPGLRFCEACEPRQRVLVSFFLRDGWALSFVTADCTAAIGPIRSLRTADAVRETVRRGRGLETAEQVKAFEEHVRCGRGSAWLELTAEQVGKLRRGSRR